MERHRGGGGGGGDRYGNSPDTHRHFNSTKYSRGGPPYSSRSSSFSSGSYDNHHHHHYPHHRRSPSNDNINTSANNYRGGGGGARDYQRAFDSPPRYNPPPPSAGGPGGGAGDRGRGAGSGGFNSGYPMPPLSGQKRGYSYFDSRGSPKDRLDGGNFTKLFVGSVPRTATEEDIRPLFDDHGRVLEVALIRDKRTGQQQGCCFIKYATSEEADRAIRALHNQYTLPGGVGPIQVRYADGERERLGALEFKLFVGSLNKQATEREVEEIFAPYGQVEDVYLMRDDMRQSRGCGFVKYSHREMALAAINALNGIYTMQGCDQPLTVRFADPKRPRFGESRGGAPEYGGPGFAPRFPAPGIRPATNLGEPLHDRIPPNAWQPMSPQNLGPPSNAGLHGFGNRLPPTSGDIAATSAPGRILGSVSGNAERLLPGYAVSSTPMSQSNYNQSLPQVPSAGLQRSPLQKPLQSPQHLPLSLPQQPPNVASFVQPQTSHASLRPVSQVQMPNSCGHTPLNQALPSHQLAGLGGQLSVSQPQVPLNASPAIGQASRTSNLQPNFMSALANQQQLPAPVQSFQPPTQSPSQLAQLLAQQTQTLQATFQSSQQAFSQLQQQLQMMQPSNQGLMAQQGLQSSKQQSPWAGTISQHVVNASAVQPGGDVAAAASANPTAPAMSRAGKCNWTEHTSPEGYKYYYNSTTGESKWEKPEELASYEQQQQQKPPVQQPQVQPHPQNLSVQNVPQKQILVQNQLQTQLQSQIRPQQLQQSSQSFPYQAPGVIGHQNVQELSYTHTPPVTGSKSMDDPAYYQQGHQPAQDWVWKNKPAGP